MNQQTGMEGPLVDKREQQHVIRNFCERKSVQIFFSVRHHNALPIKAKTLLTSI